MGAGWPAARVRVPTRLGGLDAQASFGGETRDPGQEQPLDTPEDRAGCPVADGGLLPGTAGICSGPGASVAGLDLCSFLLPLLPAASKFLPVGLSSLICTMRGLNHRISRGFLPPFCASSPGKGESLHA